MFLKFNINKMNGNNNNDDLLKERLFQYGPYDISFKKTDLELKIQMFDNRTSKMFEKSYGNSEISDLTQNLCTSREELQILLKKSLTSIEENMDLKIFENGIISYECLITFPVKKKYKFELILKEIEMNEIKKIEFQIIKATSKLMNLNNLISERKKLILKENTYNGFFSLQSNSGFYNFSNHYKSIIRNFNEDGNTKTVWGQKQLNKVGIQCFSIKINKIHSAFDIINAYIGIGYGSVLGSNVYNGKNCYTLTNGKVFFNGNYHIVNEFLFKEDEIKILVDFEEEKIIWEKDYEKIVEIKFNDDFKNNEIYPIVALTYKDEEISFL